MEFELKVNGTPRVGKFIGRMTGSYLRDVNVEANRIIRRSAGRGVVEVTNDVLVMIQSKGLEGIDPAEVRRAVAAALSDGA
jgi:hypothetical protein